MSYQPNCYQSDYLKQKKSWESKHPNVPFGSVEIVRRRNETNINIKILDFLIRNEYYMNCSLKE